MGVKHGFFRGFPSASVCLGGSFGAVSGLLQLDHRIARGDLGVRILLRLFGLLSNSRTTATSTTDAPESASAARRAPVVFCFSDGRPRTRIVDQPPAVPGLLCPGIFTRSRNAYDRKG